MIHIFRPFTLVGLLCCVSVLGGGCQSSSSSVVQNPLSATTPKAEVAPSPTMNSPQAKMYDIESAIVESDMKGDFGKGKETRTFTDWGLHESVVTQQEGSEAKSITISDGSYNYAFGTSDKEGMKSPLDPAQVWHADAGKDYVATMSATYEERGFEKAGTRDILGKTCDVWKHKVNPLTACIWKGVPLYLESRTPDGKQVSIVEATRIDERPTIAPETFTLPADVQFRGEE